MAHAVKPSSVEEQPAVGSATGQPRQTQTHSVSRSAVFMHAVAFVFGFGLVFTLLGLAASLAGQFLLDNLLIIQKVGAALLVIFALVTLGVFRWLTTQIEARTDTDKNPAAALLVELFTFFNTLLYTEKRVTEMHNVNRGWGYFSSFFMGVSFSAGWVPCVGPILTGILLVAGDSATATQGAILLATYSLGLGIPFLITGAAFGTATKLLRQLNRHAGIVSMLSGIFLLYVAYLLWFDQLAILTTQFAFLNQWVFAAEDWVVSLFGIENLGTTGLSSFGTSGGSGLNGLGVTNVNVMGALPLAFLGGLISFISPCVLPLVPAYIGYLSGASLGGPR